MRNGGYKIIDFKNNDFTIGGAAITIPGIYDAIESNHRKAILLSGIVIGSVEEQDRFVTFGTDSGNYVAVMSISGSADVLKITVTDEDAVTFSEV